MSAAVNHINFNINADQTTDSNYCNKQNLSFYVRTESDRSSSVRVRSPVLKLSANKTW